LVDWAQVRASAAEEHAGVHRGRYLWSLGWGAGLVFSPKRPSWLFRFRETR
jgi:hypothetical protein